MRDLQEAAGAPHEGQYSHLYAAAWQTAVKQQHVRKQSQKSLPKVLLLLRELQSPLRQDLLLQYIKSGQEHGLL